MDQNAFWYDSFLFFSVAAMQARQPFTRQVWVAIWWQMHARAAPLKNKKQGGWVADLL